MSRRPFVLRELIAAPSGWFPALLVEAQTALGRVQVLGVHLHPPVSEDGSWVRGSLTSAPVRRLEVSTFFAHLSPGLPTLIAGDFNESTSGEAVAFLARRGLRSVLPEFAPRANTWRGPLGALEPRGQLDHLFSDPLVFEPLDARVLAKGRSDHLPVRAIFTRSTAARGTSLSLGSAG
ncbi:MAG: endonuclease/exonuclease/phosphatase family protein [Myxococcota bacterium]